MKAAAMKAAAMKAAAMKAAAMTAEAMTGGGTRESWRSRDLLAIQPMGASQARIRAFGGECPHR
jgi:hypothetical protein